MKKYFMGYIYFFTVALALIAFCMAMAFKSSPFGDQLKINDFLGYTASFGGAILGSMTSLLILYFTIAGNEAKNQEDRIYSLMPILKVGKNNNANIYDIRTVAGNQKKQFVTTIPLEIKNIGLGPARDIKLIYNGDHTVNSAGREFVCDLGVNETIRINIDVYDSRSGKISTCGIQLGYEHVMLEQNRYGQHLKVTFDDSGKCAFIERI